MGYVKLKRISIKRDGIYATLKISNDDMPYRSEYYDSLTKAYNQGGQRGLDREVLRWLTNDTAIVGWHKSVAPYRLAINKWEKSSEDWQKYFRHEISFDDFQASLDSDIEKAVNYVETYRRQIIGG